MHEAYEFSKQAVAKIEAVFQSLVYDIKLLYYCYFSTTGTGRVVLRPDLVT